jgi:DNA-binding NtrC family response regulator
MQPREVRVADFSQESLELMREYTWPGNIRELRNAVERGLAMARSEQILPIDLPASLRRAQETGAFDRPTSSTGASRADALDGAERDYLISLLTKNSGNVAESARQAGMSRQGLHKLLKKHRVDASDYRS